MGRLEGTKGGSPIDPRGRLGIVTPGNPIVDVLGNGEDGKWTPGSPTDGRLSFVGMEMLGRLPPSPAPTLFEIPVPASQKPSVCLFGGIMNGASP